jgi:hypothetical protein
MNIKRLLKRSRLLVALNLSIWKFFYRRRFSPIHVIDQFPLYAPYSGGSYSAKAALALKAINNAFPALSELSRSVGQAKSFHMPIAEFARTPGEQAAAQALQRHFDAHGSDKSAHRYHFVYGAILSKPDSIQSILEVGIGTNFEDTVSGMGRYGKPGASLRAFRDYCQNAQVVGLDIDRRVLFSETRIRTFYVDQTSPGTFELLPDSIPECFDLIIDDGLHSPDANLWTLEFAWRRVRPGGWIVIEDIAEAAIPVWEVVGALLPARSYILDAGGAIVFAVQKAG